MHRLTGGDCDICHRQISDSRFLIADGEAKRNNRKSEIENRKSNWGILWRVHPKNSSSAPRRSPCASYACFGLYRSHARRESSVTLFRSATSVAANYRAACRSRSTRDFVSKLGIVEEEADESLFWLQFIADAGLMPREKLNDLISEASQLTAIFVASRRTAKRNNRKSEIENRKSL